MDKHNEVGCCGCSGGGGGGGSCTYSVTILSAVDSSPISGATVAITSSSGVVACSGTTDSDGIYTCTPATTPSGPTLKVCVGDCCFSSTILCGVPATLYTCTGSIDYQAIDDAGADASGMTYQATPGQAVASPELPGVVTVLSMTGGSADLYGRWTSTTAGTAVFCYWGPTPVAGGLGGTGCDPGSHSIGRISVIPFSTPYPKHGPNPMYDPFGGYFTNYGNADYWETCSGPSCVTCGTNAAYHPQYWRKSQWLASPCCGYGCVGPDSALPFKLYATVQGPAGILGSDAGSTIELDWDPTSWDGTNFGFLINADYARGMVFKGPCEANGAGGYCYVNHPGDGTGICKDQALFVPYGSSQLTLGIGVVYNPDSGCQATLRYRNYWAAGCPTGDDPAPLVCPGSTAPQTEAECFTTVAPAPGATPCTEYFCFFPMSVAFVMVESGDPFGVTGCTPIDWRDDPGSPGSGWSPCCHDEYTGATLPPASATVTE